jgi:hypothetical protein
LGAFDAIIWQKYVDLEIAQVLKAQGKRQYWDVCDPMWWWDPKESDAICALVDGVVTSNNNLEIDLERCLDDEVRTYTIPDRLEVEHFPLKREHSDLSPVRLIWYGIASNRVSLYAALANLERLAANGHRIELTIFDDHPEAEWCVTDAFAIYHTRWSLEKENAVIASHDIALLPPYPGPWGKVKSNNKTLTAWACGLPVWDGLDYALGYCNVTDVEHRILFSHHEIPKSSASARDWEEILCA